MVRGGTRAMRQRRLRDELRRLRTSAGHTQKAVAEAMGWSNSKIIRIETGAVPVSTSDVMALLHFYECSDQRLAEELLAITRAKDKMWWDAYRPFYDQQFLNFLDYENAAVRIRVYHGFVVPGLLQVEEYARALIVGHLAEPEMIQRSVDVRMRRQELLSREDAPKAWFVIDEAALHRWIGGPDVLVNQLIRLKEAAQQPNISIRIVPYTVGMHPGMRGSFTIFEFSSKSDGAIINFEHPNRDELVEVDQGTNQFVDSFYALENISADPIESEAIIDSILNTVRFNKQ